MEQDYPGKRSMFPLEACCGQKSQYGGHEGMMEAQTD